jgi:hypothetical protein
MKIFKHKCKKFRYFRVDLNDKRILRTCGKCGKTQEYKHTAVYGWGWVDSVEYKKDYAEKLIKGML